MEFAQCLVALQLLVAMAASMGYMTIGLVRGWSSPGLPSMVELNPELIPSEEIESWVSKYRLQSRGPPDVSGQQRPICTAIPVQIGLCWPDTALWSARIALHIGCTLHRLCQDWNP